MPEVNQSHEQLIRLDAEIRELEQHLRVARSRKKWFRISFVYIGIAGLVMYLIFWIPGLPDFVGQSVYPVGVLAIIGFGVTAIVLRNPGGPLVKVQDQVMRRRELDLELALALRRDTRKHLLASSEIETIVRRVAYKEDAYKDVDELRVESNEYRRVNNTLQGILIIGSLAATGTAGVASQVVGMRWAILVVTFVVGISSGFMGYFKYKERSFYLQQTADAIEHEIEAVEVGVGRYKDKSDGAALADFVEEVHRLKSEQKKRQQNLEQPPEARDPNE